MKRKKKKMSLVLVFLLICIALLIGVLLYAKSIEENDAEERVVGEVSEEITEGETGEVTEKASEEELDESVIEEHLHGFSLPTDLNISDVEYELVGDILEIRFTYENYTKLIARIAESDTYEDISGADYPWTFEADDLTLLDRPTHTTSYFAETESVMLITWYEEGKGVNVSLEAQGQDLNGFDIFAVAERMLPSYE